MNFETTSNSQFAFHAGSEQETERLGRVIAEYVQPGCVIALCGNLGAGKTRLVRAIASAMGVDSCSVNSPTFVLVNEYDGRLPICHFDAYRLRDVDEFDALGAAEILAGDAVCFVEWADRVRDALPRDHLRIDIDIAGATAREFRLTAGGPQSLQLLGNLSHRCSTA